MFCFLIVFQLQDAADNDTDPCEYSKNGGDDQPDVDHTKMVGIQIGFIVACTGIADSRGTSDAFLTVLYVTRPAEACSKQEENTDELELHYYYELINYNQNIARSNSGVYMTSQSKHNSQQQIKSRISCSECGISAPFCLEDSQISEDSEQQTFIIQISEVESYCMRCLELQVQKETQATRVLEERFIYFKQFESSFEELEIGNKMENDLGEEVQNQIVLDIERLKGQHEALDKSILHIKQESNNLKQKIYNFQVEEEKFWEGINKIERRTHKVEEKALQTKIENYKQKEILQQLSKFSVIHKVMDIRIDDNLAYVQGMAMGRKTENAQILWDEVAIGLGHLLIGMNFLALKYSYEYQRFGTVVLKGSQSQITLQNKKKVYSLLNSKQNQKSFGQILQAFLCEIHFIGHCILQSQSIEYSEQFRLPFQINPEGRVSDIPIDPLKLQQRMRWQLWSKAMRYMLIDFKHLLTVYAINDKHL